MMTKATEEVLFASAPGSRASTARQLWATRVDVTSQLFDEVRTMLGEGYMLAEIARALGTTRKTLDTVLNREMERRREMRQIEDARV